MVKWSATFLHMALYLGFCFAFASIVILLSFASGGEVGGPLLTVSIMVIGFLVFRASAPSVYMDSQFLYIARYGMKAAIPLDQIANVSETKPFWPFRPYSATIHFTTDTPFGRSLYLGSPGGIPSITFRSALEDLRRAADSAQTTNPSNQTSEVVRQQI